MMGYEALVPEPAWRKARCTGGECLEVVEHRGMVLLRDSKDPDGGVLRYSISEWHSFVEGVKAGQFDDIGANTAI